MLLEIYNTSYSFYIYSLYIVSFSAIVNGTNTVIFFIQCVKLEQFGVSIHRDK